MDEYVLEPGDEDVLESCPICEDGYMVPTLSGWYQCTECGIEAQMDEETGLLLFDEDIEFI